MKRGIFLLVLAVAAIAQAKGQEVKGLQFYLATGSTYGLGNNAADMAKAELRPSLEFGIALRMAEEKSVKFKVEYANRYTTSSYAFEPNVGGIVRQSGMVLNVKAGTNLLKSGDAALEVFGGVGVVGTMQKRIPNAWEATQQTINDGFGAYWGMSIDLEFAASIPLGSGRTGLAIRTFMHPPFTFAAKDNVPKIYQQGIALAWFCTL